MNAIILYSTAEYCDHAAKLTIKRQDKQIRTEIWSSEREEISVKTIDFKTKTSAYKNYKIMIADAILGGWKVLNIHPQRETWETRRSK